MNKISLIKIVFLLLSILIIVFQGCDCNGSCECNDKITCVCKNLPNDYTGEKKYKKCYVGSDCNNPEVWDHSSSCKRTELCYEGDKEWSHERTCKEVETKGFKCPYEEPDNDPPNVEIKKPLNSDSPFKVGEKIEVIVNFRDEDKNLKTVFFRVREKSTYKSIIKHEETRDGGFGRLGIDRNKSFKPQNPGCYDLLAYAIDGQGKKSNTAYVRIKVGGDDACDIGVSGVSKSWSLNYPAEGQKIPHTNTVDIKATASGNYQKENVDKIEIYVDGALKGEKNISALSGEYVYEWTPGVDGVGKHVISAKFYFGKSKTPEEKRVNVEVIPDPGNITPPTLDKPVISSVGRMYSMRVKIPGSFSFGGATIPVKDAAFRVGDNYCNILNSTTGGTACKIYDSESDVVTDDQIGKTEAEDENVVQPFLIYKVDDAGTYEIRGITNAKEYEDGFTNALLTLNTTLDYTWKINFSKGEKDVQFNELMDRVYDMLDFTPIVAAKKAATDGDDEDKYIDEATIFRVLKAVHSVYAWVKKVELTTFWTLKMFAEGFFDGIDGVIEDGASMVWSFFDLIDRPAAKTAEIYWGLKEMVEIFKNEGFSVIRTMVDNACANVKKAGEDKLASFGWEGPEIIQNSYLTGYSFSYLGLGFVSGSAFAEVGQSLRKFMLATRAGQIARRTITPALKLKESMWYFTTSKLSSMGHYGVTVPISKIKSSLSGLRAMIKGLDDDAAKHLWDNYNVLSTKFYAMTVASGGDWVKAKAAIERLIELNKKISGKILSEKGADGWLSTYPILSDLESLVDNFMEVFIRHFDKKTGQFSIERLDEVLSKVPVEITPLQKIPGNLGITVKFKGFRLYFKDVDAGIDNKFGLNPFAPSRFTEAGARQDVYIGDHLATSYSEVRKKLGKNTYLWKADIDIDNIFDLEDANMRQSLNITNDEFEKITRRVEDWKDFPGEYLDEDDAREKIYGLGKMISDKALAKGYKGIVYPSAQHNVGKCLVLFEGKFDKSKIGATLIEAPIN